MHRKAYVTRETPAGTLEEQINRQLVRIRPGRLGWGRGPEYRGSRLIPGEGRGLSWKSTQEVTKAEGLAMSLTTPESVQKLQAALHDKAKKSPDLDRKSVV